MDSLISQPDVPAETKKTDTETSAIELSKVAEDANGNSEELNENGKADSTDGAIVNNLEADAELLSSKPNAESTGDEKNQQENCDQTIELEEKSTESVDSTSDRNQSDNDNENANKTEQDIIESSIIDLEKDSKNCNGDADEPMQEEVCAEAEENGKDKVETGNNDLENGPNKCNGDVEKQMEVEECVTEPDFSIFDIANENHVETDLAMDDCEIIPDKDVNSETAQEQEHFQENGEAIIRNFLPDAASVSKRKPKKHSNKKKPEVVQTISDDSDTDSDSSTEDVNVEELKISIANLLNKLKPKVLSNEEEELKQRSYSTGQIQFSRLHCTACNKHMGSALSKQKDRYVHPMLKVLVCKSCYNFYTSGDFEKDEDGSELYCRWCGQGGKVICCSKCVFVFCTKCITRNCGTKRLQQIKSVDDWLCFGCNPSPLMKFQVQCTALIEYLRDEMTRLTNLHLDNANLYKMDYSHCCSNRKRSRKDTDFSIEEELSSAKKTKGSKTKNKPILISQEEEEVVCAPDLLSFMSEDDQTESINVDDVTIEKPTYSQNSPPPLQPRPTATLLPTVPMMNNFRLGAPIILPKNAMLVQNSLRNAVIVQTQSAETKKQLVHNPASMVKGKGKQIVLNTTLKNPITTQNIGNLTSSVEKVSTHKITLKTPNHSLPKLVPGLKYEWFDSASKSSLDIQAKLSYSIAELSVEKQRASTMEDLATIHNKFQEMLSKSINSMIQIRRSLRNDFLASLNHLKFIKNAPNEPRDDDDDVVFVNSTGPAKSAPAAPSGDSPQGPYLKVKTVSQLRSVPPECITIPDEVIEKISETKKEGDAAKVLEEQEGGVASACDVSNDSNKENVEGFAASTIEIEDDEEEKSGEVVPTKPGKDAEGVEEAELEGEAEVSSKEGFEKRIGKLVRENLKYNETY